MQRGSDLRSIVLAHHASYASAHDGDDEGRAQDCVTKGSGDERCRDAHGSLFVLFGFEWMDG